MLRIAAIALVLLALPASAVAARRIEAPATPSGIVARVAACDVGPGERSATFYARMESISGAARLAVRFQLLERLGRDDDWTRVDVPALRGWRASQLGVKRFGWRQSVENLNQGGAYKARVHYRWAGAGGGIVETATKDTPVCRGPLPNLALGAVSVRRGPTDDTRVYRVEVANTSKFDVDDLDVSLAVDRAMLDMVTVTALGAGDTRTVSFTGPVCRREITADVDPDNTIGERSEDDNSRSAPCP